MNVLIVRFPNNQLGDILCSAPMFFALKKYFPNCNITLIAAETNYEIDYKKFIPYIDEVIYYKKKSLKEIFSFYKYLRKKKFNIGIIPSNIKLSRTSHIINFLSGAKTRVGANSIDGIKNKSSALLNLKSDFCWNSKQTHQIDRGLDIIRQLGINFGNEIYDSLYLNFSNEIKIKSKNLISSFFPDSTRKIIGFHPGAGKLQNMWESDKFIELIVTLYNRYNIYVVLTAGKIDTAPVRKVTAALQNENIEYKVLTDYPVLELGAFLSEIDLYITNDTGTMHLAAYANANVIALFGPTNEWEWKPKSHSVTSIKSDTGNINDIQVQSVIKISEKLLGNTYINQTNERESSF